jgi:hypothetical protein
MVAYGNGHTDIVELLVAVPGVDVNVVDVSRVSGKRLHVVISYCYVRCESEVWWNGFGAGQGDPGGGLRGWRAVTGVAVSRSVGGLR